MSTLKWHKSLFKLELKAVWYVTVLDRVLAQSGLTKMKIKFKHNYRPQDGAA